MMEPLRLHYVIDGEDFTAAGEASSSVKQMLKKLGLDNEIVRRVAICMYEGEINMVIHAHGGQADVVIGAGAVTLILKDNGPGIEDIDKAMQEGFSTAPEKVRDLGFGAGMGLPNMKKYSDDMSVESKLGQGTTVIMRIRFEA